MQQVNYRELDLIIKELERLGNCYEHLNGKHDDSKERIEDKLDELNTKIEDKFNAVLEKIDRKLDTKADKSSAKFRTFLILGSYGFTFSCLVLILGLLFKKFGG